MTWSRGVKYIILLVGSLVTTLLTWGRNGTKPPLGVFSGRAVLLRATARGRGEDSSVVGGFSKSLFLVYWTKACDSL